MKSKKIKIRKEKNGKFLVYIPGHRNLLVTNEIGYEIINYYLKGLRQEEILSLLMKNYNANKEILERDLTNFLKKCKKYGVLK